MNPMVEVFEKELWVEALTATRVYFDGKVTWVQCLTWPEVGIIKTEASTFDSDGFQACLSALVDALEANGINPWSDRRPASE